MSDPKLLDEGVMPRGYPEWIVILSGRITAAVRSGEWGRVEVAELIRKTVTAARIAKDAGK